MNFEQLENELTHWLNEPALLDEVNLAGREQALDLITLVQEVAGYNRRDLAWQALAQRAGILQAQLILINQQLFAEPCADLLKLFAVPHHIARNRIGRHHARRLRSKRAVEGRTELAGCYYREGLFDLARATLKPRALGSDRQGDPRHRRGMTATLKLSGAQALVRLLAAEGVPYAFGIVGGKLAPLLQALAQQREIRFVGVRHEASGPMMAAAVAAGSDQVAVALGEMPSYLKPTHTLPAKTTIW